MAAALFKSRSSALVLLLSSSLSKPTGEVEEEPGRGAACEEFWNMTSQELPRRLFESRSPPTDEAPSCVMTRDGHDLRLSWSVLSPVEYSCCINSSFSSRSRRISLISRSSFWTVCLTKYTVSSSLFVLLTNAALSAYHNQECVQ